MEGLSSACGSLKRPLENVPTNQGEQLSANQERVFVLFHAIVTNCIFRLRCSDSFNVMSTFDVINRLQFQTYMITVRNTTIISPVLAGRGQEISVQIIITSTRASSTESEIVPVHKERRISIYWFKLMFACVRTHVYISSERKIE